MSWNGRGLVGPVQGAVPWIEWMFRWRFVLLPMASWRKTIVPNSRGSAVMVRTREAIGNTSFVLRDPILLLKLFSFYLREAATSWRIVSIF